MEKVTFIGSRGLTLTGAVHRPEKEDTEGPCLIICHGFRGGKDGGGRAIDFAKEMASRGFYVLRFDFSGTGESEGNFAGASLSCYIQDLHGAVDFMTSLSRGKIYVLGRSMGGTTAICAAAKDERIAGVCTWAAPVDLTETFVKPALPLLELNHEVLEIPEGDGVYLLNRSFFEDLRKHNIIEAVRLLSPRPIFIIHGAKDKTVSFNQGKQLFEAAGSPREKLFHESADHRFTVHYEDIARATAAWLLDICNL